jgi:putative ABC transport system ATP-binding protein
MSAEGLAWQDLSFDQGGQRLDYGCMALPPGSVLLLQGPSGCGKSTLLSLLCALKKPSQGQLWMDGVALHEMGPGQADRWRADHVGFMPQRLVLDPALPLGEQLAMAAWVKGLADPQGEARKACASLGLSDLAGRRPDAVSGGEAQRAALARALLGQPALLLVDEPTSQLDDGHAAQVIERLADLQDGRRILVVATHDARLAAGLAAQVPAGALHRKVWT